MGVLPGIAGAIVNVYNPSAPVVAATAFDTAGNTSSTALNLPASISAGNLLVLIVQIGRANVSPTISTPADWTLLQQFTGNGNLREVAVFYKSASGSEGATVTVSANNTAEWCSVAYRITDWTSGNIALASAQVTGSGSTADPPAVNVIWNKGFLAIPMVGHLTSGSAPTPPSGYGSVVSAAVTSGTANRLSTAQRSVTDGSDGADPGVFTLSGSYTYVTNTLLIW